MVRTMDGNTSTIEPMVRTRAQVISLLQREAQTIRDRYKATALYLYGSAARDELRPDSDIDVFVDFDPNSRFSLIEQIGLQDYLKDLLQRDVDLTTRGGLHPLLKARIERSSVKVL